MFCPQCGQGRSSMETSFCSRCGFPLVGVAELLANRGNLLVLSGAPEISPLTPRKRGLKQSLYLLLSALLIFPLIAIIVIATGSELSQTFIPSAFLAIIAFLRMIYAVVFQSDVALKECVSKNIHRSMNDLSASGALPTQISTPVPDYVSPFGGDIFATASLADRPPSVTEGTTHRLEKDSTHQ